MIRFRPYIGASSRFARGIFAPRREESLPVRMIALAIGVWTAVTLGWIGSPWWAWMGGVALLCTGHAVSWRPSHSRIPIRAIIVGVGVIGSLALTPGVASQAAGGDWLPAAHFLLLYQAITSFELRSRSGLYASIGLSGAIVFFASQHAVDPFFGIFLTGFATLVLAFFAVSFLVDQLRDVEVRWFGSRFSFGWFWCGVLSVALAVSLGVFLLLPKSLSGTDYAAHASALPLRATAPTDELEALARNGPVDVQGPLNEPDNPGSDDTPRDADASGVNARSSVPPTEPLAVDGPATVPRAETARRGVQPSRRPATAASPVAGGGETREAPAGDPVVMNVRSPVLTYWRDRVFDTFDGARWVPGSELWTRSSRNSGETVYFPDSAGEGDARPRYVQTYFLRDDLPDGVIPTGYDPISATAPGGGSIVRVVSALPDFDGPRVRTGRASRADAKYLEVPPAIEQLRGLAASITNGAGTDMDRLGRIATYLELTHELDVTADPLALTAQPWDFALGSSPGTSLDFATATALLGRAAGVPTRVAQGYLPGNFDPLSGTYEVRSGHRHAWVEAYSPGHGWVPFEATPRPELDAYHQAARTLSPLDSLFSAGLGDDVVDAFRSAPHKLSSLVRSLAGSGMVWSLAVVLTGIIVAAGSFVAWKMAPRLGPRARRAGYSKMAGRGRREVLRAYFSAERMLTKLGAPARRPSQTFLEHTAALETPLGDASGHLVWLRDAAWAAAYGPQQVSRDVLAEARLRLRALSDAVRALVKTGH